MIKEFNVNDQNVKVLQENEEANTRTVEFAVEDLTVKQEGQVAVDVPGLYSKVHEVDLVFDTDSLETTEPSEYPEDENEAQLPESEVLEIADGDYTIEFAALHAEEDKASAMARYISDTANLSVKGSKTFLTLTVTDHKTVTGFQVEK